MNGFKHCEAAATLFSIVSGIVINNLMPGPRIHSKSVYRAVLSLHSWISSAKLALPQLGMIPVYTTKSSRTVLCYTEPYRTQLLV